MSSWVAIGPRQIIDKRSRLTRTSGLVRQSVRAWQGQLSRKGEDGKQQIAHCIHAHSKPSSARKCAEIEARRRNK